MPTAAVPTRTTRTRPRGRSRSRSPRRFVTRPAATAPGRPVPRRWDCPRSDRPGFGAASVWVGAGLSTLRLVTDEADGADRTGVRLLGASAVRELAAELDLRPTKQRGQNFVVDANTVRRIVRTAEVTADDVVLEVGPGLGSLTLALLERVRRVTAIEVDDTLAAALPETLSRFAPERVADVEVVHADAMRVAELPGPQPTALVANLPYNVAVPVLLHLLGTIESLRHGLVMVQAEVADRLVAAPGSGVYGVAGVETGWYGGAGPAGRGRWK